MSSKSTGIYIRKTKLVKIYQRMKRSKHPLKIWIASDFNTNCQNESYLKTLMSMGLIEEVSAVIENGSPKYNRARQDVKGYRLT